MPTPTAHTQPPSSVNSSSSCLTITPTLLTHLANHIISLTNPLKPTQTQTPSVTLILSIGSGTGHLESQLESHLPSNPKPTIEAVEVTNTAVPLLPPSHVHFVPHDLALHPRARAARVLIFAYPRSGELVARYLQSSRMTRVRGVIWLGPRADWEEQRVRISREIGVGGWTVEGVEREALREYEVGWIFRRVWDGEHDGDDENDEKGGNLDLDVDGI